MPGISLGHGMFIADVRVPGVQDVAFVRSPMAHAQRAAGDQAAGRGEPRLHAGRSRRRSISSKPAPSSPPIGTAPTPPLADERVRYAGQTIAACLPPTRALAEDIADQVTLELEELPAVVDCVAAMRPDSPRVFETWPDNAYITSIVSEGDPETLAIGADPPAPAIPDEPAGHRLARMPRRARLLGSPQRRAGGLPLDPGRPCQAARAVARRSACPNIRSA